MRRLPVRNKVAILFVVGITLVANDVSGQATDSLRLKHIFVSTNWTDAVVEVDGNVLGTAVRKQFVVPSTSKTVKLIPPTGGAWDIHPIQASIDLTAGDSVSIDLDFPHYYKFESAPYGASVVINGASGATVLGTTPFLYESRRPLSEPVEFRLAGFFPEAIAPGDAIWNRYVVEMKPENLDDIADHVYYGQNSRSRRWWIDAAAVATAATAGVLAIHYKFKADSRFDEYERTGNPALRPEIDRLDNYSAVSLVMMEAGIGLFAIRLVLR